MIVRDGIRRNGVSIRADQTIRDAAQLMERAGVGALAVIDDGLPVGIVTDRDLVRRAVARGVPVDGRVDGVMTTPPVTIEAADDLRDVFALFRRHAIRRLMVTADGTFVGMITVDDLLMNLAGDLNDLARPVTAEVIFGHHDSAVPATT